MDGDGISHSIARQSVDLRPLLAPLPRYIGALLLGGSESVISHHISHGQRVLGFSDTKGAPAAVACILNVTLEFF